VLRIEGPGTHHERLNLSSLVYDVSYSIKKTPAGLSQLGTYRGAHEHYPIVSRNIVTCNDSDDLTAATKYILIWIQGRGFGGEGGRNTFLLQLSKP